jgi:hypothetical protein
LTVAKSQKKRQSAHSGKRARKHRTRQSIDGRETPVSSGAQTNARKTNNARSAHRWSQRVTQESDALDLKHGVFTLRDPKRIASSLKRSAEHSSRRKANPYRSALSMLTFYINRAGKSLPATQKKRLERAKAELKHLFHRPA